MEQCSAWPVQYVAVATRVTVAMRIDGTRLSGHGEETDTVAPAGQLAEKRRRQRGRRGEAGNEASAQQGSDEARCAHRRT